MDQEFEYFKKTLAEAVMAHVAEGGHVTPLPPDQPIERDSPCRCPLGCVFKGSTTYRLNHPYPCADDAAIYLSIDPDKLSSFMIGFDGDDAINVDVSYWALGREYRERFAPGAP